MSDRLRPPLVLSTWSIHRALFGRALDLEQVPALANMMGCVGVELDDIFLRGLTRERVRAIRTRAQAERQRIFLALSNDFTVPTLRQLGAQVRHVMTSLELASYYGSPIVRVLVGSSRSSKSVMERVMESMVRIHVEARRRGIALAVENHDALSNDPDVLMNIVTAFPASSFGVCLDTGNFPARIRYRAIETCASRTTMLHVKAWEFRPNGNERTLAYDRIAKILWRAKFVGPAVIEYDGSDDQLIGSLKTLALARRYLHFLQSS